MLTAYTSFIERVIEADKDFNATEIREYVERVINMSDYVAVMAVLIPHASCNEMNGARYVIYLMERAGYAIPGVAMFRTGKIVIANQVVKELVARGHRAWCMTCGKHCDIYVVQGNLSKEAWRMQISAIVGNNKVRFVA